MPRHAVRRLALTLALTLTLPILAALALAQTGPPAVTPPFATSFENGLDGWDFGADVPNDPNGSLVPVYHDIVPTQARSGSRAAVFLLDGRQDDGTVWLTRAVSVTSASPVTVSVQAFLFSPAEYLPHAYVALYAGSRPPAVEEDFIRAGDADDHAGWKAYEADFRVTPVNGTVWVAVGISAIWETKLAYSIDDVSASVDGTQVLSEDFEGITRELEGWTKGADVPADPNRPGRDVVWSVEPGVVQTGERAAGFFIDGAGDDGIVWLTRPISVTSTSPVSVTVETSVWSSFDSFNTLAMVALYAGPTPPQVEADFVQDERADDHEGWRPYRATFSVTPQEGRVWVAVGLSVVWETLVWFPMDDVRVCVDGRCHTLLLPYVVREGGGRDGR